jgi:pyruvate kinase
MINQKFLQRRTKIVATIGPATNSVNMIERLARSGMDIVRFNLSHGSLEEHAKLIKIVRNLNKRTNNNISILIDLPGPKYRIGKIKDDKALLKNGEITTLTTTQREGNSKILPVNLLNFPNDIKTGDVILLADGALKLRVLQIIGGQIECRILVGGVIKTGKGIIIPRRHISEPYLTPSMMEDILFATDQHSDFIALSFVSSAEDIEQVKNILRKENTEIPIIAKIEREEAVRNFNTILDLSDGIMIARGDLGVEIPLEKVPIVQKDLIRRCNRAGKAVITATEMLESMITSTRPTRAEATDVANAIFDGTDAIMLSGETAIGKYPTQTVKMMAKIAREAERTIPYEQILNERGSWIEPETDELISYSACHTARRLKAKAIIAYTQSGSTARRVSRFRPSVPILALTPDSEVNSRLIINWGVFPIKISMPQTVTEMFKTAIDIAKDMKFAKPGDLIVITGGIPAGHAGTTNMLKVEKIN